MWVIGRVWDHDVGKKAIEQVRPFETKMNEGVESMPDEENANLGTCAAGKQPQ